MSANTKIEYPHHSWSPWLVCSKCSPGCQNCFAEAWMRRFHPGHGWGPGVPRILTSENNWKQPLRWERGLAQRKVFQCRVCDRRIVDRTNAFSPLFLCRCGGPFYGVHRERVLTDMCDPFDPDVPVSWLVRYLGVIAETPHLDWLVLTKRPEHWADRLNRIEAAAHLCVSQRSPGDALGAGLAAAWLAGAPPANIWLGISVENQKWYDKRMADFTEVKAAHKWLSCEPLLGPIEFGNLDGIEWVICGGESGPNGRYCKTDWIRWVIRDCKEAGVPCFVKQLGKRPLDGMDWVLQGPDRLYLKHPKGGDPSEWAEDMRVREFPAAMTQ